MDVRFLMRPVSEQEEELKKAYEALEHIQRVALLDDMHPIVPSSAIIFYEI